VIDFELFIGAWCDLLSNIRALCTKSDEQGVYTNVDRDRRASRASSVADLLREHRAKEHRFFRSPLGENWKAVLDLARRLTWGETLVF